MLVVLGWQSLILITLRASNIENTHDTSQPLIEVVEENQTTFTVRTGSGKIPFTVFGVFNNMGHDGRCTRDDFQVVSSADSSV
jgi:hypothetical protein